MSEKIRPVARHSDWQQGLVVCAWCGAIMREGPPPVSHGICPACTDVQMPSGPLALLTPDDLDRLPFGLIRLSGDGTILSYNRTESGHSRRTAASVVGRNFFTQVAPCTDVQGFHGRLDQMRASGQAGRERFSFAFRLPWATVTVELALTYDPLSDTAGVIVDWPPEAGART